MPISHENHCGFSSSRPPSTGPSATAPPTAPAQAPIARPRSRGGKTTVMIASVTGMTAAPPIPMIARKAMSCAGLRAIAEIAEPTAKMASPISRIRLRPYLSPSTPQVNRSAAKTST